MFFWLTQKYHATSPSKLMSDANWRSQ